MCKKYNGVAQGVLKKMHLEKKCQEYKKHKYRQDYFIIMLMIAKKAGKLETFKKNYRNEVQKLQNVCLGMMKQTFKDSTEFKKYQALL